MPNGPRAFPPASRRPRGRPRRAVNRTLPRPPAKSGARALLAEQNSAATPVASACLACSTTSGDTVTQFPRQRADTGSAFSHSTLALAALLALSAGGAHAFDIDSGNPDLAIRFDNTVRANFGVRVECARLQDRQLGPRRRRRLQLRQRAPGRRAHRPAVRVRPRLQEALRPARQRRGLVRRRLQRHEQVQSEPAAGRDPELHQPPVQLDDHPPLPEGRRAARRLRLRWRRSRRSAGAGQARPAHDLLGRIAPARRQPAQRLVCAVAARPAEGLRDSGHRGQGAVPAAEPAVAAGPAHRDVVGGRPVHARVGVVALSRGRHLPRPGRLRLQRPGPPVPVGRRSASRRAARRPSRRSTANSVWRRAGRQSCSTAPSASTTATTPTSCRRSC